MAFDTFRFAELARADQSKLINGSIVPRPIAWVSTLGADGRANLAPFSYFNVVAVEPCIVMFSISVNIGPRAGTVKDTLQNLQELPEFVVHLVDRALAENMNLTSAELPTDESEFLHAGLTELPSTIVRPPRIAEANIHMECRVHEIIKLGRVPYHMVLGEVLALHARQGIVNERHHVNPQIHQPVSRLGGPGLYSTPTDQFTMKQPA